MSFLTKDQIFGDGLKKASPHERRSPFDKRHRAPRGGYSSPVKHEWRERVWLQFGAWLRREVRPLSSVFMVETTEANEIETALRHGYAEKNLHVCNVNPAIVATLKRRFPSITTYGVDADRALRRSFEAGIRFDLISLDLCGPLSLRTLDVLDAARSSVNGFGMIALTMLRGREPHNILMDIPGDSRHWRSLIKRLFRRRRDARRCLLTNKDYLRVFGPFVRLVHGECSWSAEPTFLDRHCIVTPTPSDELCRVGLNSGGVYRSSNQTMMWLVFTLSQPFKWAPRGNPSPLRRCARYHPPQLARAETSKRFTAPMRT